MVKMTAVVERGLHRARLAILRVAGAREDGRQVADRQVGRRDGTQATGRSHQETVEVAVQPGVARRRNLDVSL